ncbi:unnamed protein product [Gongylonema pulchrum]|uniref:Transposase n=1 Tax=Gongylonema pulchrum TaxID=637853 RepID=A0A183ERY9_9BILA|nr:unnamed protein product [Gongylonema pulchrum]
MGMWYRKSNKTNQRGNCRQGLSTAEKSVNTLVMCIFTELRNVKKPADESDRP